MISQKVLICIEEVKEDKVYRFNFPMGVTYQSAYDACIACGNQIVEMSKIAIAQEEAAKKEQEEKKEGEVAKDS